MTERHRKTKAPRKRQRIPGYTPEEEFAEELRVKKDTLRKWRRLGKTCAYVVLGRQIHYVDADKPRWLESLRITPPRAA